MSVWHLSKDGDDYGITYEMIVVAPSPTEARMVAGRNRRDAGDSRAFDWVDDQITELVEISTGELDSTPRVVMTKETAG